MLDWICLLAAGAAASVGALNAFRAPERIPWWLGILAGELGHVLAAVPVAAILLVLGFGGRDPAGWAAVGLGLAATALLLKPAFQAWRIGRELPGRLSAAFGPSEPGRRPFSVARLFGGYPESMPVETLEFAPGLFLDFYRAAGRKPAPWVVLVHGGGWDGGDRGELAPFNRWLAGRGYAVAAVDYRLAPGAVWPAQRDDILAAVAELRSRAPELGIDPARWVLLGRSAGGQLAEAVGYGSPPPGLRGVVALYAPADLNFAYEHGREDDVLRSPLLLRQFLGGPPGSVPSAYDQASGIRLVRPGSPPTLLLHGKRDVLVWHRQSERLAEALRREGVPSVFLSLPWATHAFEFNLNGPGGQLGTYAIEWFLGAVTRAG